MNKSVDNFFINGCERCDKGGTPSCKVNTWRRELLLMREILNESSLKEECKWGFPCYTHNGKNVVMIGAFKAYCSLNFFKGKLLNDSSNLLESPGPNSNFAKLFKFQSIEELTQQIEQVKAFIDQAIEIEKSGKKISTPTKEISIPEELLNAFERDQELKTAFYKLTPGRQRGYILQINQAKQVKTRNSRIEKFKPMILQGIGFNERPKKA